MSDIELFPADVSWFRTGDGNFATDTHIRVIRDQNGDPLFIASDIARALGYRMASDMTRRIDDEDRGTRSVQTPSGCQDMTVLNEAGLYAAIFGSQVESAKQFKRWVTRDVLPQVRRVVGFGLTKSDRAPIANVSDGSLLPGSEFYLYVVELVGVGVKVGISASPERRVSQHRRDAEAYGRDVGRVWMSVPHIEARANESALKRLAGQRREYLSISFETATSYAAQLPFTRGNREAFQRQQDSAVALFQDVLAQISVSA